MTSAVEITRFAKSGGPLTKRIELAADGSVRYLASLEASGVPSDHAAWRHWRAVAAGKASAAKRYGIEPGQLAGRASPVVPVKTSKVRA
jgi:hypothetical protein